MEPERARHHVRNDDVTLDLVDEEEEEADPEDADRIDEERVDRGRHCREPRPDVGNDLDERGPEPEEKRVLLRPVDEADRSEDPHPETRARADHGREDQLPAYV